MLRSGERQVATRREDIRADHVARYEWAAKTLPPNSYVIDAGCGIGYGAQILAEAGHKVFAIDVSIDTIVFARQHFDHPNIEWQPAAIQGIYLPKADAVVCFEMIEHVADPGPILAEFRKAAPRLLASVPNEEVFPWKGYAFHHRHYSKMDFEMLLAGAGWEPRDWFGQAGPESPVEPEVNGRTLVVSARHAELGLIPDGAFDALKRMVEAAADPEEAEAPVEAVEPPPVPEGPGHVVILGLGPSAEQYMDLTKRLGGRKAFADEVWAINALGDIIQCDLVFHMDDVRVQERRAEALPQSNIANMVKWLKTTTTPVITSRAHPDYPALIEFPLEDAINDLGFAYFNGTGAYACAYAIHKRAKKISFFGCDYTYANAHHAEQGRACLEFWIGFAAARGIELGFADATSLLDTVDEPKDPNELNVYGYDFDRVKVQAVDGLARITFEPREATPTAAEIEARYDHTKHPSPLLRDSQQGT